MAELTQDVKGLHSILPELEVEWTEEDEYRAALEEMKRDEANHMIAPVLKRLVASNLANEIEVTQALMPHLIRCSHCRHVLRQTNELQSSTNDDFAVKLVTDAEIWSKWQAAATTATEFALRAHLDAGVGYVYERDGVVYRRLPDGEEVTLC